jgi:hypothetical protein
VEELIMYMPMHIKVKMRYKGKLTKACTNGQKFAKEDGL